jgi:hypothetical protein
VSDLCNAFKKLLRAGDQRPTTLLPMVPKLIGLGHLFEELALFGEHPVPPRVKASRHLRIPRRERLRGKILVVGAPTSTGGVLPLGCRGASTRIRTCLAGKLLEERFPSR